MYFKRIDVKTSFKRLKDVRDGSCVNSLW